LRSGVGVEGRGQANLEQLDARVGLLAAVNVDHLVRG